MTRTERRAPDDGRSCTHGAQVVLELEVEDGRVHLVPRRATYRRDPSITRVWPQAVPSGATPSAR